MSAYDLSTRDEQLRRTARRWTRLSTVYDIGVRVLSGPRKRSTGILLERRKGV